MSFTDHPSKSDTTLVVVSLKGSTGSTDPYSRAYDVHSPILIQSLFFKALLSPLCTDVESSSSTLPITITVAVESTDKAESLDLVLRVLYRPWEDDAQSRLSSAHLLLGAFLLAVEYQFPDGLIKRIADMLGDRMVSMGDSLDSSSTVHALVDSVIEVYSLPLDLRERLSFAPLSSSGRAVLQRLFREAPAVITDAARMSEFLRLPAAAVLAWARDDHLIAHTENCVVYVLSAWARGPVGANASADELEALACSVRVGDLRPSYLGSVLPLQPWFSGTRACAEFLPALRVYLSSSATAGWCGPPAWILGARMRVLNSPMERHGNMDWTITPEQLVQLRGAPGTCVRSPSLYINGAFMRLAAAHHAVDGGGVRFGAYVEVDVDAMRAALGELPEHAFVVAIKCTIEVKGAPALMINCVASRSFGSATTTAMEFAGLVAPHLEPDGTLRVMCTLYKLE